MAYLQFFVFGFKGFLSTISPGAPEFMLVSRVSAGRGEARVRAPRGDLFNRHPAQRLADPNGACRSGDPCTKSVGR
jgi:hypothetical protein